MLTLTERAPDSPERAIALSLLARAEFWAGQSAQAMRHVDEALRIAELSGSDEALAWAHGVRSEGQIQVDQEMEDAEQGVRHATATHDRVLLAFTAIFRANSLQSAGLKGEAADRTLEIYSELVATGSFYEGVHLLPGICERLLDTGRWSEAHDLLRESLSHRITSNAGSSLRWAAAGLAARTGDLAAAQQHLIRARELAVLRHLVGDSMVTAETRVAMAVGDPVRALTLMAEAMPSMRTVDWEGADELLVWAARATADLAANPAQHAMAVEWLEKMDELRGDSPPRFVVRVPDDLIHPAWASLFAAEAARCRDGGARRPELWHDAMLACAAAGLPWEQALCAYWLAQSLLATKGSRTDAAAALRDAARIAAELGAAPILADVESLAQQSHLSLAPTTAGPDDEPSSALAGLTRREDEVLRHLVAGRTYAEIARALFISEKTVSVHVSNLLRKTGTSSRIELADLTRRARPG
jgi:DNA-binding CsgD family transcriptional regulator